MLQIPMRKRKDKKTREASCLTGDEYVNLNILDEDKG